MIAFEIHTYTDGQWKVDSVFDFRELALANELNIFACSTTVWVKHVGDRNSAAGVSVLRQHRERNKHVSDRTIAIDMIAMDLNLI